MARRKSKRRVLVWPLVLLTCGLVAWLTANNLLNPSGQPAVIEESEVITYSTDTPEEAEPEDDYDWKGSPDDPKYIKLPTIAAEGYVQKVGVDQNDEIAVPNNIHIAGWFVNSVRPGEMGLSIIDGHVDGRQKSGIFKNLSLLRPGEHYEVELGNGSIKNYQILSVRSVPNDQAHDLLFSKDPQTTNQLNLITCGGEFDRNAGGYQERVVVTSELVN